MNFKYALTAALLCGAFALAGAEKKAESPTAPAKLEAEKKAKLEAEKKAKIEAEKKAKLEAEKKAKLEAEKKAKLEAEQKAKIEAEKKAKLEAEKKAQAAIADETARFDRAWKNVVELWNAKKYDEVEAAVSQLEKTYKNPPKSQRAMRYGDLYASFNGDEKLRPVMNAKARAWLEICLAAAAEEKNPFARRGALERLILLALRTGDAAGFRQNADAVADLFPANDARTRAEIRRHQLRNLMRYAKDNPALTTVADSYLKELFLYAAASSDSRDTVSAYELAVELAYAEGDTDKAEKTIALALAQKNLSPVLRARIHIWRYAGGRGFGVKLADVEKQIRLSLDAVGKDDPEAVSLLALQLAERTQHRGYNTFLAQHRFDLMNELLALNLTDQARLRIASMLIGMYEFNGEFGFAARFAENTAADLEKRAVPKASRDIADLYVRAGGLILRSAGYLQQPTDADAVKAFELYNRALKATDQTHPGALLAIIELAAARNSMSTAVSACGKLSLLPKIDPNTVELGALDVAEGYFSNGDFVRSKEWLAKVSPNGKRGEIQLRVYDLAARLACIDADYAKALEYVDKLERTNGQYAHRRELKEYRKRLENLLPLKK